MSSKLAFAYCFKPQALKMISCLLFNEIGICLCSFNFDKERKLYGVAKVLLIMVDRFLELGEN